VNNREAIGWYDKTAVYLPTARLRDASNGQVREQWLASLLKDRKLLARQGGLAAEKWRVPDER
jgi:hypothetical protein